jgi:hypothetical protein
MTSHSAAARVAARAHGKGKNRGLTESAVNRRAAPVAANKSRRARLTAAEIGFLDATIAGFRLTFGVRPERFRFIRGDDFELIEVECTGAVEEGK